MTKTLISDIDENSKYFRKVVLSLVKYHPAVTWNCRNFHMGKNIWAICRLGFRDSLIQHIVVFLCFIIHKHI